MKAPGPVVIIDNYDSFTYNLYQYVCELVRDVRVVRNDKLTVEQVVELAPTHLIVSPGPKDPQAAGISIPAIRELGPRIPVLGVCLGHQSINEAYGGRTVRAPRVCHGKTSRIRVDGKTIYRGLPTEFRVARYHSLVVDPSCLGSDLEVTAWTDEGVIMGVRHRRCPIEGVQFHPESFLTEHGMALMTNYFEFYA